MNKITLLSLIMLMHGPIVLGEPKAANLSYQVVQLQPDEEAKAVLLPLLNTINFTDQLCARALTSFLHGAAFDINLETEHRGLLATTANNFIILEQNNTYRVLNHGSEVISLCFSYDTTHLVSVSDTTLKIWETASGNNQYTINGRAGERFLSACFFGKSYEYIASLVYYPSDGTQTIVFWRLQETDFTDIFIPRQKSCCNLQ